MSDKAKIAYAKDIGHNIIKSITFLPNEKFESDFIEYWEYLKRGPIKETKKDNK